MPIRNNDITIKKKNKNVDFNLKRNVEKNEARKVINSMAIAKGINEAKISFKESFLAFFNDGLVIPDNKGTELAIKESVINKKSIKLE